MLNKQERQVIKFELDKEQKVLDDLERQYKKALRDIDEKIKMLQSDELTKSRIYQIQYQQALRGQVAGILDKLQGDEFATIQQYLHESYQDGFIGTMYSIHGQGIPLIVPLDQDAAVKAIITDSKISEGLYKHLGVNVKQLKQAIRSEITRGIASNMPFADIARNISNRSKASLGRAKTIVRTEAHRIQQAAASDARDAAKDRGCDVVKQWDSTLDSGTRPTHKRLDGQIRETDKPFEIDKKKKAMYPGDFGYAEEDCNCRCVALTRAKWALDEEELEILKQRAKEFGLTEEEKKGDFAAFKEKYLKAAKVQSERPKFNWIETNEATAAVEKRWEELDAKYHAKLTEVEDSLLAKQREYDLHYNNYVEHLLSENPRMRRSTAERKTLELMGARPDENAVAFLGGDYNMSLHTMTLNQHTRIMSYTFEEDIERRKRKFARWERNREKYEQNGIRVGFGNVTGESLEGVFLHEYGHAIDATYDISNNPKFLKYYRSLTKEEIEYGISDYATTDKLEFIAECFAESFFDDQREISKGFMKVLEEIINDTHQRAAV